MLRNKLLLGAIAILCLMVSCQQKPRELIILHTNDSHSQIEPYKGNGGYEARYLYIDSMRKVNPNLLLFDAGDIFQGTPYFNLFNGSVEIEGYNLMKYDAATFGNHEFDLGLDTLAARIKQANFPFVISNYKVEGTPLEGLVKPYLVINKQNIRVGVIGLGVKLNQLAIEEHIKGIEYLDPIEVTTNLAEKLRSEKKCDLVVVISHLGFNNTHGGAEVTDSLVAAKVPNIDLILGGHTHNITGVYYIQNPEEKEVIVAQENKAGVNIYKYTITYE